MTKFAEPSFSVAAPITEAYAAGYQRTFSDAAKVAKACTACAGAARGCEACEGTGLRSYQSNSAT